MAYPPVDCSRVVLGVLALALLGPACGKTGPSEPNPGVDAAVDTGIPQMDSGLPPDAAVVDGGWTPPAACALPFEVGPCDAAIPAWAFVDGACVPRTYGGCQGNDNRFSSFEACLAACAGRPVPNGCPAGRVAQGICLQCGAGGGCSTRGTVCALPCGVDAGFSPSSCPSPLAFCHEGVCQVGGCI